MKENYQAIALGKRDIGEADRLYTFYTREKGLVRVGARGVRKVAARLSPHVEDYTIGSISIAQNNGPGTLAGAYSEYALAALREDYEALIALERVKKYIIRLVQAEHPDGEVYELLVSFLMTCEKQLVHKKQHNGLLVEAFLLQLYDILGYQFVLRQCATCGDSLQPEVHTFSAYAGGVLCDACARNEQFGIRLDVDTQKTMRLAMTNNISQLHKINVSQNVLRQLMMLTDHIATWIMR